MTTTEAAASSTLCPVGPAQLNIARRCASQVDVSWPHELDMFQLENRTNVALGGWTPVSQTPATIAGKRQVTLTSSTGRNFFRLRSPLGQQPQLFASSCGSSGLTLFWHRNFAGYRVDEKVGAGSWTAIPETAIDTNGFWQVTVSRDPAFRSYRLAIP